MLQSVPCRCFQQRQKRQNLCWPLWQASFVQPTPQKASISRSHLCCKHMQERDKLPPTLEALRQHVLIVHIPARVWGQASIALQVSQMDALQNSYHKESDVQLKPTMTAAFLAPSLRWFDFNANNMPDVLAEQRTYPAPIFVSVAVHIRMMMTHRTIMKLMMMICDMQRLFDNL